MIKKSWSELELDCPVDILRIIEHAREFESNLPHKIKMSNIDKCKEAVIKARSSFDSMVTTLTQILYQREVLVKVEDKILFAWLIENFGRYLKRLDDEEFQLIVKLDSPENSEVGISRVSSYAKLLETSSDTIIYETLLKSTKEYKEFKETESIKREPRTFLYILFQVLQVTLSILGGLTREKTGLNKKGVINTIPSSWQSLMMPKGGEVIRKGYEEDTGTKVEDIEETLGELNEDYFQEDTEEEHVEDIE